MLTVCACIRAVSLTGDKHRHTQTHTHTHAHTQKHTHTHTHIHRHTHRNRNTMAYGQTHTLTHTHTHKHRRTHTHHTHFILKHIQCRRNVCLELIRPLAHQEARGIIACVICSRREREREDRISRSKLLPNVVGAGLRKGQWHRATS